jgi:hypothetical protein
MSCPSVAQNNPVVGPESGRITVLLENARQCAILRALGKKGPVGNPCRLPLRIAGPDVPRASDLTASKMACLTYRSLMPGPESARINALQRAALDASTNPLDPAARFSRYVRPFPPPVCQAIPQEALNANVPRMQGLRCPLPNRPDLIVLPG